MTYGKQVRSSSFGWRCRQRLGLSWQFLTRSCGIRPLGLRLWIQRGQHCRLCCRRPLPASCCTSTTTFSFKQYARQESRVKALAISRFLKVACSTTSWISL
eukprot:31282_1